MLRKISEVARLIAIFLLTIAFYFDVSLLIKSMILLGVLWGIYLLLSGIEWIETGFEWCFEKFGVQLKKLNN